MYQPIRSEADRRLIGHIKKKSRKKKINVYFNKKSETTGKTKYIQGDFYSAKNDEIFKYKSSYELRYLETLENSTNVIKYLYEPFELPYVDFYKKTRSYIPDFMVLYADGSVKISEIKPEAMLKDYDVQAKASATRKYIKEHYEDLNIEYIFVTEKDLFKDITDYGKFIRRVKGNDKPEQWS